MPLKREKFTLTNDDIDRISGAALEELSNYRVAKENLIRTRFSLEEALLRLQEHFGSTAEVELSAGSRFSRHIIEIKLRGKAYNPLRFSESEYEEWNQLLSYADYQPDYHYQNGINVIRWSIPVIKHHPALYFSVAILLGILLGYAGRMLPADSGALSSILEVFEEVWIRLLNVISGPAVFLLIITTVLNMDSLSRQGGSANRLLIRVFRIGFISSAVAIASCLITMSEIKLGGLHNAASDLVFLLLQLIPEDALSPFAEANSPQLLLLAFVLGTALIASGRKHYGIANLVREANSIILIITRWMGDTAPFFICILLAYEIMEGNTAIYTGMWKPVLLFLLVSAILMICFTMVISRKEKVSPVLLIRKLKGPFIRTISEGSADSAYDETLRNCQFRLGMEEHYAESGLSIGLVLYMPISAAGTLIFTIYAAGIHDVSVTVTWYLIAAVMAVAMSVASPPVPGVEILTYVVLFSQLGIPKSALIAAMVFNILTNILTIAENQYMLQLEMIYESERMAMLDKKILRSED